MKRINELGVRHGKLVVLGVVPYLGKSQGFFWQCICDCGQIVEVSGAQLRGCKTRPAQRQCKSCRNVELVALYGYMPKTDSSEKAVYRAYKSSARERKISFSLSLEEFKSLIFRNCDYCGTVPSNHRMRHKRSLTYNGIDRVCNTAGYELSNCVPCCRQCNQAKMDFSKEAFLDWLRRAYEHNHGGDYKATLRGR